MKFGAESSGSSLQSDATKNNKQEKSDPEANFYSIIRVVYLLMLIGIEGKVNKCNYLVV